MTFALKRPATVAEVTACVDLYFQYNDETFLPANRARSIAELTHAISVGRFAVMALDKGQLVGWVYAREANIAHLSCKTLQQHYYASNLTGIKAVKLITALHDAMLDFAEDKEYEIVLSAGSHMDSTNVFVRVLAKNGWDTRGYLAAKKTRFFKDK